MKGKSFRSIVPLFLTGILMVYVISCWGLRNAFPVQVVTSNSMSPAIPAGSILIVDGRVKSLDGVLPGEPLVFYNPFSRRNLVHRVIQSSDSYLITRGDQNPFVDEFQVTPEFIIGSVYAVFPVNWANAGLLLVMSLLLWSMAKLRRYRKRLRE